jgi:hypothetical protein
MATRLALRQRLRRKDADTGVDKWDDDEMNDAINDAINAAWPSWYVLKTDTTTVTTATDTFTYTLPTDCEFLAEVWLEQESTTPHERLYHVRVARNTTAGVVAHTIYLDRANNYESGKTLRLVYEARAAELDDDTTSTSIPTGFGGTR